MGKKGFVEEALWLISLLYNSADYNNKMNCGKPRMGWLCREVGEWLKHLKAWLRLCSLWIVRDVNSAKSQEPLWVAASHLAPATITSCVPEPRTACFWMIKKCIANDIGIWSKARWALVAFWILWEKRLKILIARWWALLRLPTRCS